MLEPYNPNRLCPKCHSTDVVTTYMDKALPGMVGWGEPYGDDPYFIRGCRRCQYKWAEAIIEIDSSYYVKSNPMDYSGVDVELVKDYQDQLPEDPVGSVYLIPESSKKIMKMLSKRVTSTKEALTLLTENLKDYKTEMFDYIFTLYPFLKDYIVNFNHDDFKITLVKKKPV